MADLAVLGPIDVQVPTLELVEGEGLAVGTEAFLIGYPGEVEAFPQPAITRGLISRYREWESIGITYFQTDATIAGGQSGGVLVSGEGEVIGVSGLMFSEADFGLIASSADVMPRIRDLISGRDPSGLGERRIPTARAELHESVSLRHDWDQRAFMIDEPVGTVIEVKVTSFLNSAFAIYDSLGIEVLFVDEHETAPESGSFTVEYSEPYFLVVWQSSQAVGRHTIDLSHNLIPLTDPDDGLTLEVGQQIVGNIDFPGDVDRFSLTLEYGETVEVVARSGLADPFLLIDFPDAGSVEIIFDDDSGGGLFGLDSKIVYQAPFAGIFSVIIFDPDYLAPGGYVISVEAADQDATLTSTTYDSLFDEENDP